MKRTIFIFLMLLAFAKITNAQGVPYTRVDTGSVNKADSNYTFDNTSDKHCQHINIVAKNVAKDDIWTFYNITEAKHGHAADTNLVSAVMDSLYSTSGASSFTGHTGTVSWRIQSDNINKLWIHLSAPSSTVRRNLKFRGTRY